MMQGTDPGTAVLVGIGAFIGLWIVFKVLLFLVTRIIGLTLGILLAILAAPFVLLKAFARFAVAKVRARNEPPLEYTITYHTLTEPEDKTHTVTRQL